MSALEIVLFILAVALVIISFFIVDNNQKIENKAALPDTKELNAISTRVVNDVNRKADNILTETEEHLEKLSNDKIMAVGEYSNQIIEKMDTNHKEVVFLYQMLQDKEKELKSMATQLDNVRIECEKLIREKEEATLKIAEKNKSEQPGKQNLTEQQDKKPSEKNEAVSTVKKNGRTAKNGKKSVFANSTDREEQILNEALSVSEKKNYTPQNPYMPKNYVERPSADSSLSDRNREILELYRQKKTVLEISKLLNMGQGEVRLIIDLYGK